MLWLIFSFILTISLLLILYPWKIRNNTSRNQLNHAGLKSRLAEIEKDIEVGNLPEEEKTALREETALRAWEAGAATPQNAPQKPESKPMSPLISVICVLILVAGAGFYLWHSPYWKMVDDPDALAAAQNANTQHTNTPDVAAMVQKLADRLKNEPDNLEGWTMLGKSYTVMGKWAEAATAYHQVNKINQGKIPESLVDEAVSLAAAQGDKLMGQPIALIEQALKLDPNYAQALWYRGLVQYQIQDNNGARAYWDRLANQDMPEDFKPVFEKYYAEVKGGKPVSSQPENAVNQAENTNKAPEFGFNIRVNIDSEFLAKNPKINKQMAVFIYAKAQSGMPMPLAVLRKTVADLPMTVRLTDGMAMMENVKLSSVDSWQVIARISPSGSAMPQPEDMQIKQVLTQKQLPKNPEDTAVVLGFE